MAKQSGWVTINGVHVFIDGKSGKITQGPAKFIGSTLNDLPSNKSSQADLKARLQAKQAEKSSASKAMTKAKSDRKVDPSRKKKSDGLVERAKRNSSSAKATVSKSETNKVSTKKAKSSLASKETNSSNHTFEDVASEKFIKSSHKYQVKFNDGTTVKLSESEYDKLYSGKAFDKAFSAKQKAIEALEGKPATAANITASYDRRLGRNLLGGNTFLKNSQGEDVEIYAHGSEFSASIIHSNGARSIVYGKDAKDLSAKINDRSQHYNAPKNSASTGNSLFDNATKVKVAKNPNNRLHTGRESSNGLNPKQEKLFNQYVKQGYSGNDAYKIATTGRVPSVQVSGGAAAPTSSRHSNSARVSNTKTVGEFLKAINAPTTARTRRRGKK